MNREQRERAIIDWVRRIPAGKVASYGQIAELAGLGRGARQVGRVLSTLGGHSDVPWHRVLNSRGEIRLALDSDAGRRQRRRLRAEGVVVNRGRVRMADYAWQVSLDERLWGDFFRAE